MELSELVHDLLRVDFAVFDDVSVEFDEQRRFFIENKLLLIVHFIFQVIVVVFEVLLAREQRVQHQLFCSVIYKKHIFSIFFNYDHALFKVIEDLFVVGFQNFRLHVREADLGDHQVDDCAEEARPKQVEDSPSDDN